MERRRHGLQLPMSPLQIIVLALVFVSIVLWCSLCVPFLAVEEERWLFVYIYVGIFVVGLVAYFRVSLTDHDVGREQSLPSVEGSPDKHCAKCHKSMGFQTKHCYNCRKCVDGFDHHCNYLNTCIGTKNYHSFIVLITCLSSLLLFQTLVTTYLLVDVAKSSQPLLTLISESVLAYKNAYMTLQAVTVIIPFGGFLAILSLLMFHLLIICKDTTTIKWIYDRRDAKELKLKQAADAARAEKQKQIEMARVQRAVPVAAQAEGDKTSSEQPLLGQANETRNGRTKPYTIESDPSGTPGAAVRSRSCSKSNKLDFEAAMKAAAAAGSMDNQRELSTSLVEALEEVVHKSLSYLGVDDGDCARDENDVEVNLT
mmetsp:Transcript_50703/g.99326  ORF Transcript_50703/g.99326 Transcript_50703/m.99326 type:complete len:370 (+) Transcript_50703:17-1126(+)